MSASENVEPTPQPESGAAGCCGAGAQDTAQPCCGTSEAAAEAGACCAPAAKSEAVTAGSSCC